MGVTANNLIELTATDNTNDEVVVYDNSASRLKKISPDNLRDSLLTGSALVTCDDTTLTASRAVLTDGSGQLAVATTTTSELQALNSLTASRAMVTDVSGLTSVSATTSAELAGLNGLTANRAVATDGSGVLTVATTTDTELGYVNGVTSALQTQINNRPAHNLIINGNFDLWDMGTSPAGTDDTYPVPGWWFLSDGNSFTLSQESSDVPTGSQYTFELTSGTAGTTRCGIFQILEQADALAILGGTCSLSFSFDPNSQSVTSGYAIYAWSSTADAATSDLVNTWAMPPTSLVSNWTLEGSDSTVYTPPDTDYRTETLANISVDTSSAVNVGVFIGVEFGGSGSTVRVGQVQLVPGPVAQTFRQIPVAWEKERAQRRYLRIPGDASANGPQVANYAKTTSDNILQWLPFPVEMRTTPATSVNGTWALSNCTGPLVAGTNSLGTNFYVTASGNDVYCTAGSNGADDYLEFAAEPAASQPF